MNIEMPFVIPPSSSGTTSRQMSHIAPGSSTQNEMFSSPPIISAELPSFSAFLESDSTRKITIPLEKDDWTSNDERHFQELVKHDALGIASFDEISELESLASIRRLIHHPRTPDEIIREYKQHLITVDLLRAMERYVEFFKAAS